MKRLRWTWDGWLCLGGGVLLVVAGIGFVMHEFGYSPVNWENSPWPRNTHVRSDYLGPAMPGAAFAGGIFCFVGAGALVIHLIRQLLLATFGWRTQGSFVSREEKRHSDRESGGWTERKAVISYVGPDGALRKGTVWGPTKAAWERLVPGWTGPLYCRRSRPEEFYFPAEMLVSRREDDPDSYVVARDGFELPFERYRRSRHKKS